MSRNFLLVSGAICWTVAGIDAVAHLVTGDLLVPAAMASAFALWVALRGRLMKARRAAITVEAEG